MTYALDSNIVINLLKNAPAVKRNFDAAVDEGRRFVIPALVDYEILRGFYYHSAPNKERLYKLLTYKCPVGETSAAVWRYAARLYADLRQAGYTVGDADIFIGAFCIVNDYTLVTNNTKDFCNMDGLRFVNWAE